MRKRALELIEELKSNIPGFYENKTPANSTCDYFSITGLTEQIRQDGLLELVNHEELNSYIGIAHKIMTKIKYLEEGSEDSFRSIDSILDSIWHHKPQKEMSTNNKRELAKLAISILNPKYKQYWVDDIAPSASSYNHCIYFIFMLEDRFRNENEEFLAVYNGLKFYINKYGSEHHFNKRWNKRLEDAYK